MKIFANKSYRFDDPNKQEPSVTVRAGGFNTVPDWVGGVPFFKMAVNDGSITITETPKAQSKAEKAAADKENEQAASKRNAGKVVNPDSTEVKPENNAEDAGTKAGE